MLLRATLAATMRLSSIFVFILLLNARRRRDSKLFAPCNLSLHRCAGRNQLAMNKMLAG